MGSKFLLVPSCEPGRGGGHLGRCIALARDLRAIGREAMLYVPDESGTAANLLQSKNVDQEWRITDLSTIPDTVECIILDRFRTPVDELSRWKQIAPVVGIDEGGCRDGCDFLIDILVPEKLGRPAANIADPSLLPLGHYDIQRGSRTKKRVAGSSPDAPLNVLISFGQEDTAGLGIAAAHSLSAAKSSRAMDITLIKGALAHGEIPPLPNVHIRKSVPALAEHLGEYDLVITHYGITAYESLYAGTPVLLAHPTPYHAKLAKAAGFSTFRNPQRINAHYLQALQQRCAALAHKYCLDHAPRSLAECINGIAPHVSRNCPACGAEAGRGVSRFTDRTYRRCPRCGVLYMDRTNPPPVEYGREYFFELYQKQYGKTYIEDFPHLTALAQRRLNIIQSLLPKPPHDAGQPLLDIGCAYGPFLAAAREEGFSPCGIDPAEDAVRYVTQTLGIPAVQGFFPGNNSTPNSPPPPYSVITLWYVIEHFRGCIPVLAEIQKLLKPGGVLAFATPSHCGISGRASLKAFLERSPADHWTIWSPAACKRILAMQGFKVQKIVNCGHHPERFPLLGKFARSRKSPLYRLLWAISILFRLGDTFEVYARKAASENP